MCVCHSFTKTIALSQGMNFVAATLLMQMKPEDAFWCFVAMLKVRFCPAFMPLVLVSVCSDLALADLWFARLLCGRCTGTGV